MTLCQLRQEHQCLRIGSTRNIAIVKYNNRSKNMQIKSIFKIAAISLLLQNNLAVEAKSNEVLEDKELREEAKQLDIHMDNLEKYGDYCSLSGLAEKLIWTKKRIDLIKKGISSDREDTLIQKDESRAYMVIGTCYLSKGKLDSAIQFLNMSIEKDPKNIRAYNKLAEIYNLQGKYEKAVLASDRAIGIDKKSDYAYVNKGNALLGQYESQKARKEFSRAISINKRNVDAYIGKAKSLNFFDENAVEDGIKACDIGLEIGPKRDKAKVLHRLKGNLLEIKSKIVERNKKYKNPRREKISLLFKAVDEYQAAMPSRSFNGGEELDLETESNMAFNELTKEYFMIARDELNRLHKLYPKDKKIEETLLSLCNYPGSLVNEICNEYGGYVSIDVKLGKTSDYERARVGDTTLDEAGDKNDKK